MEITEDSRKGETLYTVKLLFEMPVSKGSENIKRAIMSASCCFIAEDQMHVRRLIGLKEKPRPAVAVSRLNEEKPGGKVLYRDAGWLQGFPNELREIVNPQKNTVTVNRTYISINTPLGVEGIEFKNGKA
ncbi:MAG: hypothetical protein LBB73_08160, partial [Dysgonamonadaceae bacterium]|nr:hypothetical protein [Dysgonamonadaceae bacterium]